MMYNGMVKETTIANDRKQKLSNSILLSKELDKETSDQNHPKELESLNNSDSSDDSPSDTSDSDSDSVASSDNGYTSDVTNYNSTFMNCIPHLGMKGKRTMKKVNTSQAPGDYSSFTSDSSDFTTSRSSSSEYWIQLALIIATPPAVYSLLTHQEVLSFPATSHHALAYQKGVH